MLKCASRRCRVRVCNMTPILTPLPPHQPTTPCILHSPRILHAPHFRPPPPPTPPARPTTPGVVMRHRPNMHAAKKTALFAACMFGRSHRRPSRRRTPNITRPHSAASRAIPWTPPRGLASPATPNCCHRLVTPPHIGSCTGAEGIWREWKTACLVLLICRSAHDFFSRRKFTRIKFTQFSYQPLMFANRRDRPYTYPMGNANGKDTDIFITLLLEKETRPRAPLHRSTFPALQLPHSKYRQNAARRRLRPQTPPDADFPSPPRCRFAGG